MIPGTGIDTVPLRTMAEEIAPSREGWERLKDSLDMKKSGSDLHPKHHVDIVIQYQDASGSSTVEGTLVSARRSTGDPPNADDGVNGWFGKIKTTDVMVNIYADPDHGGPRIIFTDGWDGTGGKRYKWEIEQIVIEEKPGTEPQCFGCHSTMVFGYIDGWPDGPGTTSGWLCQQCAAQKGRIRTVDIERGLP